MKLVRQYWIGTVRRVRARGRSATVRAVRLAGASVAAFLVAELVGLDDPPPLVAALTALIVVQVTLTETILSGLQRVMSVVAGVMVALAFVSVTGLTWWSLGLLVTASIVVGQLLRLGPQLIEAPISAMLVLGVGSLGGAESAAWGRVAETLVGTAVGLAVNLAVPPAVKSHYAGAALQKLADEISGLLDSAALQLPNGVELIEAQRWLDDARRLNRHVPRVDRALAHAEESRQLNLRALRDRDHGLGLRDGLEALEHSSVTVRSLFRSLYDVISGIPDTALDDDQLAHRRELRAVQAGLMHKMATVVRSFGELLEADVSGRDLAPEEASVSRALWALRAARADAADLLLRDPRDSTSEWDLNSDLLQAADRMLIELDLAEHTRTRDELRRARAAARAKRLPGAPIVNRLLHPSRCADKDAADKDQDKDKDEGEGDKDEATSEAAPSTPAPAP